MRKIVTAFIAAAATAGFMTSTVSANTWYGTGNNFGSGWVQHGNSIYGTVTTLEAVLLFMGIPFMGQVITSVAVDHQLKITQFKCGEFSHLNWVNCLAKFSRRSLRNFIC